MAKNLLISGESTSHYYDQYKALWAGDGSQERPHAVCFRGKGTSLTQCYVKAERAATKKKVYKKIHKRLQDFPHMNFN